MPTENAQLNAALAVVKTFPKLQKLIEEGSAVSVEPKIAHRRCLVCGVWIHVKMATCPICETEAPEAKRTP